MNLSKKSPVALQLAAVADRLGQLCPGGAYIYNIIYCIYISYADIQYMHIDIDVLIFALVVHTC